MRVRAVFLALAVAGVLALFLGRVAWLVVLLAGTAIATGEMLRLARARGIVPASTIALAGSVGLAVAAHVQGERAPRSYPSIIAAVLMLTFVELLLRRDRSDLTRAVASTLTPVLSVGLVSSFLIALRAMPEGFRLVAALVIMVLASEAVPAIVALARGIRGRLDPWLRIGGSLAGSFTTAILIGVVDADVFSWPTVLVLALLIGVAAPVGRLAAEMLERDLHTEVGVAPASVLVRFDGLLLAAPVFFYAFRALAR